jgi:hypothetical protein
VIHLLAQAADVAEVATEALPAAAEGYPAWLVGLLALLAFLTSSGMGAALVKLVRAKAKQLEAEAVSSTLVDGLERANGGGKDVKAGVQAAAEERGTARLVNDHIGHVTGTRPTGGEG